MAQNYQRIGDYISVLDIRNTDGSITNLMGISIDKCYIPSVANVIGTDLHNYKVISKGQFACSLMQVSRDQRIPLAMYASDEPAIMSPAYVLFEVTRPDELIPEYMALWFRRAEFDREASFYAVGGVRGSLDWGDFCDMKLPVPSIDEQRKIVHDYQVITDRIELLRKINGVLLETGETIFANMFDAEHDELADCSLYSIAGYINGTSFDEDEYADEGLPIIKIAELKDGITLSTQYFVGDKPAKYYIRNGEILFSWSGNPETSIDAFIWTHGDGILNQHTFKIDCFNGKAYTFFMLKHCKPEFVKAAHGKQTTGLGHVTVQDLKRLTVPFSTKRAKEFDEQAMPLFECIYGNMLEINRLGNLRQCLLARISLAKGA